MSLYNMLFGRNPAARLLLAMLDLTEADVGRFRDCYLGRDEETKKLRICIYTRNGGGNRDGYEAVTAKLQALPTYVKDYDDDYDCTYATYEFNVPAAFEATAEELVDLGAESTVSPADRFKKLIEDMQTKNMNDPAVARAFEVGKGIMAMFKEAAEKTP